MFTIVLAWINAHYNCNYELLFLGTVIVDCCLIDGITGVYKSKYGSKDNKES